MFTKVTLKNFRTFDRIEFDLSSKNNTPKKLAIIYGENGVGKSNLMSAFVLLKELMATMDVRDAYEELLSRESIFSNENMEKEMRQKFVAGLRDIQAIINDYRMVDSKENIVAEYEFNFFDNIGKYSVEMNEHEIVHERLEYLLNKRRGIYFDCNTDNIMINDAIVKDKDLLSDIKAAAKRFWGKHSILAIISHELNDKSVAYGENNLSGNFEIVIAALSIISCRVGFGTRKWDGLRAPFKILEDPKQGKIKRDNEKQLDIAERIFSSCFSSTNSNILRVFYKRSYTERFVEYELFVEKMIAGAYRNVPFSRESAGNHQLISLICYMLSACFGGLIFADELDSGIHDLLFRKILQELYPHITGQVVLTTHNTMLMEADFAREATYILSEEDFGHKTIRCVTNYEKRTYSNNNIRNKYFNDEYGGVPKSNEIDFEALIGEMSKMIDIENEKKRF